MKKFNLQLFADTYTHTYDLVLPLTKRNDLKEETTNFTIKIPNPKNNLTLAEVTNAVSTLNTNEFFCATAEEITDGVTTELRETPYIENKSIVTLDLDN